MSPHLDALVSLFDSFPLPYNITSIPLESDPPAPLRTPGHGAHFHFGAIDVMLQVLRDLGFRFLKGMQCISLIIGARLTPEDFEKMRAWTRVSHFSMAALIGGKADLHHSMRALRKRLGHEVPYYPLAFYPPDEYEELCEMWHSIPIWIIKAPALSRARAIHLSRPDDEPAPMLPYVVEQYIPRPLLVQGRKFDIRFYVLVTSAFPLILYLHQEGLALFATSPYTEEGDLQDLRAHLTNFEINKGSENFVECVGLEEKVENSKWSLGFFWRYLESQGIDHRKVKAELMDVSTSAVIAGMCAVRNGHRETVRARRRCSFELLGIDLLIDENLKVWLLEINITPGLVASSDLDGYVKNQVVFDMYNIIRMVDFTVEDTTPCQEYGRVERIIRHSLSSHRKEDVVKGKVKVWDNPTFADHMIVREFVDEQVRRRRFDRIYPKRKTMDRYAKCFDQLSYEDIALHEWVRKDHAGRKDALLTNWDKFTEEIKTTFPKQAENGQCGLQ
jgi:tubulin polyglutamylase TTLL4